MTKQILVNVLLSWGVSSYFSPELTRRFVVQEKEEIGEEKGSWSEESTSGFPWQGMLVLEVQWVMLFWTWEFRCSYWKVCWGILSEQDISLIQHAVPGGCCSTASFMFAPFLLCCVIFSSSCPRSKLLLLAFGVLLVENTVQVESQWTGGASAWGITAEKAEARQGGSLFTF